MTQLDLLGVAPSRVKLTPFRMEQGRRENNYDRVLARLRQGPATNHELAQIAGYRFGARLHEIRDKGGDFERAGVDGATHIYTLKQEPTR
jgi:hypothetical protein